MFSISARKRAGFDQSPSIRSSRVESMFLQSPSAVSEAPTTVVDWSALDGRFRYSDLKEAARRVSLWVLYVIEQVPMICKVAIGGCVRQLHREKVRRRGMLGCWVEV
jgi:hypothetical protein